MSGCAASPRQVSLAGAAALVVGTLRPTNTRAAPALAPAQLDVSFVPIAMTCSRGE